MTSHAPAGHPTLSREELIPFLSPAQAAGAPTFCDATESRQRTQPRGLCPLGHPPPTGQRITNRENSALRPPPLRLCKTPVGVPSGTDWAGDSASREKLSPKFSPFFPHTAVSKRQAANATPGGEPQRSPRSLALPLASAEKLLCYPPAPPNSLCPRTWAIHSTFGSRRSN